MDSRSTPKTRRLRAKLTLHGYTYDSFARCYGFRARTVKAAVRGERAGPASLRILTILRSL